MEAPATLARPVQRLASSLELKANSLIITIFGDAILPRGGNIWLGSLIGLAGAFGVSERLVRTGVYRLAQEGWLEATSRGRRAYYTLTPSGLEKFAEADRRIYAATPPDWDGRWRLVQALPHVDQSARQTLRRELTWHGFGLLSPTLMAHPSASDKVIEKVLTELDMLPHVLVFRASAADYTDGAAIGSVASEAWNLETLNADYKRFIGHFERFETNAEALAGLSDLDAFALRTLLVHDYRRILLKDPQLPADFLPDGWSGTAARNLCGSLYRAIAKRADAHVTGLMETFNGAIPDLTPTYHERFREPRR